jgi:hypothetical protein
MPYLPAKARETAWNYAVRSAGVAQQVEHLTSDRFWRTLQLIPHQ